MKREGKVFFIKILLVFLVAVLFINIIILTFFKIIPSETTSNANVQFTISKSKAIKIIDDAFDGDTTDFPTGNNLALEKIENMILEKTSLGKIVFNESINLTQIVQESDDPLYEKEVDLDKNVIINFNFIEIDSSIMTNLNKPATLYLYGLTFNTPRILRNGELCPENICKIIDYSNGILKFSVTGFTYYYSSEETPIGEIARGGACAYDWKCTNWQPLVCPKTEIQTRECTNQGTCVGVIGKPNETRKCAFEPGKPLLDINIEIFEKEILAGEDLIVKIQLINFGKAERTDVLLEYKITDSEGKNIFSQLESAAIETKLDLIKRISLPKDIDFGEYTLQVNAMYDGKIASSRANFKVVKKEISQKEKIYITLIIVLTIILASLIYLLIRLKRKHIIIIKKADLKEIIKNG